MWRERLPQPVPINVLVPNIALPDTPVRKDWCAHIGTLSQTIRWQEHSPTHSTLTPIPTPCTLTSICRSWPTSGAPEMQKASSWPRWKCSAPGLLSL